MFGLWYEPQIRSQWAGFLLWRLAGVPVWKLLKGRWWTSWPSFHHPQRLVQRLKSGIGSKLVRQICREPYFSGQGRVNHLEASLPGANWWSPLGRAVVAGLPISCWRFAVIAEGAVDNFWWGKEEGTIWLTSSDWLLLLWELDDETFWWWRTFWTPPTPLLPGWGAPDVGLMKGKFVLALTTKMFSSLISRWITPRSCVERRKKDGIGKFPYEIESSFGLFLGQWNQEFEN